MSSTPLKRVFTLAAALASALSLTGACASAMSLPTPFEAQYAGGKFPLSAKATIGLSRFGDYYRYTLRGNVYATFFKVTEVYDCSVMQVREGKLYPLEYVHRDKRKPARNMHTRFDWDRNAARTVFGDGTVREIGELPRPAWDVMSIQVQMRVDLANAQGGAEFDYPVVEKGRIIRHRARIEGVEPIDTGPYSLQAAKISVRDEKRTNTFWFAGNYGWLPVRLTISDVTLELTSPPARAGQTSAPAPDQAPAC